MSDTDIETSDLNAAAAITYSNGRVDRNTTHPYQPGYEPSGPHPDDTYQPTRVTARAVTTDGSVVEKAHAVMDNALLQHKKFVDGAEAERHRYTDQGYREQLSMFNDTAAAKAVDAAVTQVSERADKAAAQVDKVRRQLSPDGDTAAELRAGRYWDRTKSQLDNAKEGPFGMAQKLIASAERTELGTLLQELPAYLQAHGQPTDWIDTVVGQAVPEYGAARTQLTQAQQALIVTRSNAESLRKSFSQDGCRPFLVKYDPKYDPDK